MPMIGLGQKTYVPDTYFEKKLISLGYDEILDDYVLTANINEVLFYIFDDSTVEKKIIIE